MASSAQTDFGTIRSCIWPVHPHEYKKLVPMMLMLFLIIFAYDLLRNMKDAVIITAAGAEVIPFYQSVGAASGCGSSDISLCQTFESL